MNELPWAFFLLFFVRTLSWRADRVEHPKHWKWQIWLEFKTRTFKRLKTDAFSFEQSISSWSQISWLAMDFKDFCDFLTFQQSKNYPSFFQDLVLQLWSSRNFHLARNSVKQAMKSSCFPNCPVILSLSSEVQLSFPPQGDRNFKDCITSTIRQVRRSPANAVPLHFSALPRVFSNAFFFVKGKKLPKNPREQDATILPSSFLQFALTFPKDLPWPLCFHRFFTRIAPSPGPPLFFVTVIRKSSTGEAIRLRQTQHPSQTAPIQNHFHPQPAGLTRVSISLEMTTRFCFERNSWEPLRKSLGAKTPMKNWGSILHLHNLPRWSKGKVRPLEGPGGP